jgi:hypothetical protein
VVVGEGEAGTDAKGNKVGGKGRSGFLLRNGSIIEFKLKKE